MIRAFLNLYILLLIVDVILSYLPQYRFKIWAIKIRQFAGYTCNPVRHYLKKYVPEDIPFDFSPIVVMFILKMIEALW